MPNKYYCSNGERVTEATIKSRLSAAYKRWYAGEGIQVCAGCGGVASGTAHILPRSQCKVLHKTELIWDKFNTFPACHMCNAIAENIQSDAIKELKNYDRILHVLSVLDEERFKKMIL